MNELIKLLIPKQASFGVKYNSDLLGFVKSICLINIKIGYTEK